jgi:hypothetical protein
MRRRESVLPTYSGRDGRWRVGDGEAVRATLVDGGGGFWWSSGSRVDSRGGGGGRGSPPQVVAWCGSLWSSRATVVTRSATMARVGARRRSPKGKAFIGDLA